MIALAIYLLACIMAYDFFEILVEQGKQDMPEEMAILDERPKTTVAVMIGMALIWPYYLVKARLSRTGGNV